MSKLYLNILARLWRPAFALAMLVLLNGCATTGMAKDPLEGYNRAMFAFNDGLDRAIVKPLAQGYVAYLPAPLRTGVANFYGNIADVFISVNNLLQGKLPDALSDIERVAVNTTVGLLGVLDVASDLGLEKHDEDFGQTFGRWGVGDGPYIMLPILGPRTMRDAFAHILDSGVDPITQLDNVPARNSLFVIRGISDRSDYLAADKIVQEAALDRYAYIRDAYLQRRRSRVYDGNPPRIIDDGAQLEQTTTFASLSPPAAPDNMPMFATKPFQSVVFLARKVEAHPSNASH